MDSEGDQFYQTFRGVFSPSSDIGIWTAMKSKDQLSSFLSSASEGARTQRCRP